MLVFTVWSILMIGSARSKTDHRRRDCNEVRPHSAFWNTRQYEARYFIRDGGKRSIDAIFGQFAAAANGSVLDRLLPLILKTRIRQVRATLRDATGITFSDFHDHVFHITLGYLIDWLSEKTVSELASFSAEIGGRFQKEIGTIRLGPVEFCNFDTMHHFDLVQALR